MIRPLLAGFGWSTSRPEYDDFRLYLWRDENIVARIEATPKLRAQLRASLRFDPDDQETVLGLGGPLGSLFLSVQACPIQDRHKEREVSVALFVDEDAPMLDVVLSTSFWMNPNEGTWDESPWRRTFVHLGDKLLGKVTLDVAEIDRREVEIPLPEGPCSALVVVQRVTCRRPRWPYPVIFYAAEVTPKTAPTIPGKGENPWDCEDDKIFSLSCRARSVEEGAARFLESVLRDRQRRAGSWTYPEREARQAAE